MRDNLSIVITMLVFVILIVIFPLYNYFERQDDMSYNLVLKSTTNFVDEVINSGYIDQEMYDNFIQELAVTGNLYDIQLEAHKKTYTKDPYNLISDTYIEQYEVDYNADIFDENTGATKNSNIEIDNKVLKNGAYYLNVGDQIYVKLKNSSTTMAGAIFNVIVPTSTPERLTVNYGGIIKNNAWEKQDISNLFQKDIYIEMLLDITNTPGITEKINDNPTYSIDQSSQVDFIVKVINHDDNHITNKLKNNLKLTGFESDKFLSPTSVTKISSSTNEWRATFDLTDITNLTEFFGSDFYKTCQLELESNVIQGNYFQNEAVESDSITVKRSNVQQAIPDVIGPYTTTSASSVAKVELGQTVIYYVNYYEAALAVTSADFDDYITAEGFTYDNLIIEQDTSAKRFKLTFKNVSGEPNTNFKIKISSKWAQYLNVSSGFIEKIGELTSKEAKLTFTTKSYISPGISRFVVPVNGKYRLTVVGANGGGNTNYSGNRGSRGGKGGLTAGTITLTKGQVLYVVVGGAGKAAISSSSNTGGYNGGGNGSRYPLNHSTFPNSYGHGGGGATDIRLSNVPINTPTTSLGSRIIVAGGGGGADDVDISGITDYSGILGGHNDGSGGYGGGGSNSGGYGFINGSVSGGATPGTAQSGYSLGLGQNAISGIDLGGGGGGYYGGFSASSGNNNSGGAGGSGYISSSFTDILARNGANNYADGNGRATIEYVGK